MTAMHTVVKTALPDGSSFFKQTAGLHARLNVSLGPNQYFQTRIFRSPQSERFLSKAGVPEAKVRQHQRIQHAEKRQH